MKRFQPTWYTIPEFVNEKIICVYHKEQEEGQTGENGIRNLHVLARSHYHCGNDPAGGRHIWLRITADDYYKLYINGQYVGQGPAPAYPEAYYYNTIDIAPFLKMDENVIAVHLYYQGLKNRVWNSQDNRFGVAADICEEMGNSVAPSSELKWRYRISRARSGETTGYDTQYLENFDSRLWEEDWNQQHYEDSDWPFMEAAEADGEVPEKNGYHFLEQPTKMVEVKRRKPAMAVCRDRESPSHMSSAGCRAEEWFVDIGQEIVGALSVTAEGKNGGRVRILCGEECSEDGFVRYEMRCNCRYEEIWTLADGRCTFEPYDYKGFRYAQLIAEPGIRIISIEVVERCYPMDEEACTLKSENENLENIFRICKNAVRYGTQESYLDCPTREKGQYLGDSVVTAHAQVWLTGSVEMLRKCIGQFALTARICPGLMGVAPGALMQEIADFSLLWSQLLMVDYHFTGDREFLRHYYPVAKGILDHFSQYAREDGLLLQVADKWNLVDWPENLRDDYDFPLTRPVVAPGYHNVINALYVGAAKTLSEIEKVLDIENSYDWRKLNEAFFRTFYRGDQRRYADSEKSSHCALHSNIYPLYFGLVPEAAVDDIAGFLLEKGLCCGVMLSYFYLKALAGAGRYREVYNTIVNETEHGWVNMIREGASTCFEAWGKEQKWNTSLCHPWASAPISILIEDIAGFVPAPEENTGFRFCPHVPDELEDLRVTLPFRGRRFVIVREKGEINMMEMPPVKTAGDERISVYAGTFQRY